MIVEDHNDNDLPRPEPDLSSLQYGGHPNSHRSPAQFGRRSQPASGEATPTRSAPGSAYGESVEGQRQKRPAPIREGRPAMGNAIQSPDLKRGNPNQRRFRDAFRALEGEDGKVDSQELTKHLVKKGIITGGMANSGDLEPLFRACDRRGDGRINLQDVETVLKGPSAPMGGTPRQEVWLSPAVAHQLAKGLLTPRVPRQAILQSLGLIPKQRVDRATGDRAPRCQP